MRRLMIGLYAVSTVAGIHAVDDQTSPSHNMSDAELAANSESYSVPAALLYTKWDGGYELFVDKTNGNWQQTDTNDGSIENWREVRQTAQHILLSAVNNQDYQIRHSFSGEKTIKQPGENQFVHHRHGRWIE